MMHQISMTKAWVLSALCAVSVAQAAPAPSEEASDPKSKIIGTWQWTLPGTQCTETYDYRPDGTLKVVSGEEKSDNTYTVTAADGSAGFVKVDATIVKDYGGEDCTESTENNTGGSHVVYVLFDPSGNQQVMCQSQALNTCVGPLERVGGVSQ
jgi:hypothetical protein